MAGRERQPVGGEVPNPIAPPPGWVFDPRCPFAEERCRRESPRVRQVEGTLRACHGVEEGRIPDRWDGRLTPVDTHARPLVWGLWRGGESEDEVAPRGPALQRAHWARPSAGPAQGFRRSNLVSRGAPVEVEARTGPSTGAVTARVAIEKLDDRYPAAPQEPARAQSKPMPSGGNAVSVTSAVWAS